MYRDKKNVRSLMLKVTMDVMKLTRSEAKARLDTRDISEQDYKDGSCPRQAS